MTSRRIPLEGAWNFRDLGGMPTRDGARIVPSRVFRSDRLTRLSPGDAATLDSLDIRRVFDLRSGLELEADGAGVWSSAAGRHRHVPLVKVALQASDPAIDWSRVDLGSRYMEMLDEGAPVTREVLVHLADPDRGATVFHCTGGKDRTGVLAAVLLRTLGVDDEVVVEDYAVSEVYLAPFVEASRRTLEAGGFDPQVILYLCGSPATRMRAMIEDMDRRWGSVEGYLDWAGVGERTREALRRVLLS